MQATPTLSRRIAAMEESQTIGMAKKARELAASGVSVINLSFGEPDFVTPEHIREAAKQAIDEGFTFYTPVPGIAPLRQGIAAKLQRDSHLAWAPEQIVVSTGAKQNIANAMMCVVNPGDEVVILAPYWVSYLEIVKLAEGVPVLVHGRFEEDFQPRVEEMMAAITPRTRMVMYSSPSNPAGTVLAQPVLQALATIARQRPDIYILADEIYEYIHFGQQAPASITQFADIQDQIILINGFSKGFAMTGWRVGYMASSRALAAACDKMQGQFTSATCSIAQRAALAAITGPLQPSQAMCQAFHQRRDMLVQKLQAIPGLQLNVPEGAFYLFPKVSSYYGRSAQGYHIANSTDLCLYLLAVAHVSTVPGVAFGNDDCIRISFAAKEEDLALAADRIAAALAQLS